MTDYDPDFDFLGNAQRLGLAFKLIAESVDLEKMIVTAEYAHAIGPMLDPTKYRDALERGDLEAITDLARLLLPAVKLWNEKIAPELVEA